MAITYPFGKKELNPPAQFSPSPKKKKGGHHDINDPVLGYTVPATPALLRQRRVSGNDNYKAFPNSVKIGNSIVFLYSDGTAHAQSDRQYMARTDDGGNTYREVVFYENINPEVYNYSLISDIMNNGDVVILKTLMIVKVDGVMWTYRTSSVSDYNNNLLHSDNPENAVWTKTGFSAFGSGSIIDISTVADPIGSHTANLIVPTNDPGFDELSQLMNGFSPNQTQTVSKWVKYQLGGPAYISLQLVDSDSTGNSVAARFRISNATVNNVTNAGNGSGATGTIELGPNGWLRLILTGKPNTAGTNTRFIERPVTSTGGAYTGDGVNGYYIWRTQVTTGNKVWPELMTTSSIVSTGVSANTESYWMMAKKIGAFWYRAGYSTIPTDSVAGLFRSPDGFAWSLLSSFTISGKDFNEFDFERLDNGDFIAVLREEDTAGRQLYFARSSGSDNNWDVPVAINQNVVAGTQPNLIKLNDGRILLAVGDRTGVSGMSAEGVPNLNNVDRTGVSYSIAPANITLASQFTQNTQIGLSYGTDCGQPATELLDGNKVWVSYYAVQRLGIEPAIYSGIINV